MITNIKCLTQACDELGISYQFLDDNKNFVGVGDKYKYYFVNTRTPFNEESVARICKDKYFSYLLLKDVINTPKTDSFLDPGTKEEYLQYLKEPTQEDIVKNILHNYTLPVVVKRNTGAQGVNVFLCRSEGEVKDAVATIFDKESKNYDYVALVQQYIELETEFRVVVYDQEIQFVYEKDIKNASFVDNLSPLHWRGAQAILIKNEEFIQKLDQFIKPIYKKFNLNYAGFDIGLDKSGNLWLIEINTHPGFGYFVKDNGEDELVGMFKRILNSLQEKKLI